jgi:hypothetical protein
MFVFIEWDSTKYASEATSLSDFLLHWFGYWRSVGFIGHKIMYNISEISAEKSSKRSQPSVSKKQRWLP